MIPWRRHKGLAASGAFVVLLALALVTLPGPGLRWGLTQWLEELGLSRVKIDQTEFSLFGGRIRLLGLEAAADKGPKTHFDELAFRFSWRPLFSRRVELERIALAGLDLALARGDDGRYVVSGLPLPKPAPDAKNADSWDVGFDGMTIVDSELIYSEKGKRLTFAIDSLDLGRLRSWEPGVPTPIALKARIGGAILQANGTVTPFGESPKFSVTFDLADLDLGALLAPFGIADISGKTDGKLAVEGNLGKNPALEAKGEAAWKKAALDIPSVKLTAETLIWKGTVGSGPSFAKPVAAGTLTAKNLALAGDGWSAATSDAALARATGTYLGDEFALGGELTARNFAAEFPGGRADHGRVAWNGNLRIDPKATAIDGIFDLGGGKLALDEPEIALAYTTSRTEGRISIGDTLSGRAEATAADLAISRGGLDFAFIEKMQMDDIALASADDLTIRSARLAGAKLLQKRGKDSYPWRAEAGDARLSGIARRQGRIEIGTAEIDDALFRLTRDSSGLVGLADLIGGEDDEESAPSDFALGRIAIGGASKIQIVDRTPADEFRLEISGLAARLGALSSAAPERETPFELTGKIGEYSDLRVTGTTRPLAAKPKHVLVVRLERFDLPLLSPYAAQAMGVEIKTGQVDAVFEGTIADGKLTAETKLKLAQLALIDSRNALAEAAGLSVETALDLLRDRDGNIALGIPVSGPLDDPTFDYSDAVGQAVGAALRETVFTAIKVLIPVVGIISTAIDLGEGMKLGLEPLDFGAGNARLEPKHRERLDSLARLMQERPGAKLTLCPTATLSDWQAIRPALSRVDPTAAPDAGLLEEIAKARGQGARSYLVEKHGIQPERLFACLPAIKLDGDHAPRLELMF